MRKITLAEFIQQYEGGYITEVVSIPGATSRVYGRSCLGQALNPKHYEIVYIEL